MKRKGLAKLSFFLVLVLLFGLLPTAALAANDETVLITVGHTSAAATVNIAGRNAASLTVPYSYSGTSLNLAAGLSLAYDTTVYTNVTATFPAGSTAVISGEPVTMTLTYQRINDPVVYTANYRIQVQRAAYNAPTFTGTIQRTFVLPGSVTITVADIAAMYDKHDGAQLAAIAIIGSDPIFGELKLNGSSYTSGTTVTGAELEAGKLTFAATAAGTVSYKVKAYAADNSDVLFGSVTLNITALQTTTGAGSVYYTTKSATPITLVAADFGNAFSAVNPGDVLSAVKFTLPSETAGKLVLNYQAGGTYDAAILADTPYVLSALSAITFVPAANYAGTVKIPYTGISSAGTTYAGELQIKVGEKEDSDHFDDVDEDVSWAAEAIDYLYEHGIILGTGKKQFNPAASISRGDFILMLCRAFELNADASGNFSDVEEGSYYSAAIATAKHMKIVKGDGGKFHPRKALSRQDAMVLIVRALDAVGIDLPEGDASDLSIFRDARKIATYAKDSVAALVAADVVQGNGGNLNPKSSISRAEIAIMLYRVLTLDE